MAVRKLILPSLILFIVFSFFNWQGGFIYDMKIYLDWFNFMNELGLGNIYFIDANYPPVFYYILKFISLLFGTSLSFEEFTKYLKLTIFSIELIGVIFLFYAIEAKERLYLHWAFLVLNISFLYNSLIWGQIDGIASTLNFASVYFAFRRKWPVALGLFIISLNFKFQSVVFFPILLLLLIGTFHTISRKQKIISIVSTLCIQTILLIPFLHLGKLKQLFEVVTGAIGYYPVVSLNAANFWQLIFPFENLMDKNDTMIFGGLTLKTWGIMIFFCLSLIVLLPLSLRVLKSFKEKIPLPVTFNELLLICTIISLCFFFFNTQMHERYSHNAWLFIAAWSFINKKYFPLILFSISYFLNLESIVKMFHNEMFIIWDFTFIAGIYVIIIIYLFREFYHSNPVILRKKENISYLS